MIAPAERVLVMLDSCHTKVHVLAELEACALIVSVGSYIIAADGIMEQVAGVPRTAPDWTWNNPKQAALEFVEAHPAFMIEDPPFPFNEGLIRERVTYWPCAFSKRIRGDAP
jgi:cephalosporin hydroxylase